MAFNIGDKVKLNERGIKKWEYVPNNPEGVVGEVVPYGNALMDVRVYWGDEYGYNTYWNEDLDLVESN